MAARDDVRSNLSSSAILHSICRVSALRFGMSARLGRAPCPEPDSRRDRRRWSFGAHDGSECSRGLACGCNRVPHRRLLLEAGLAWRRRCQAVHRRRAGCAAVGGAGFRACLVFSGWRAGRTLRHSRARHTAAERHPPIQSSAPLSACRAVATDPAWPTSLRNGHCRRPLLRPSEGLTDAATRRHLRPRGPGTRWLWHRRVDCNEAGCNPVGTSLARHPLRPYA